MREPIHSGKVSEAALSRSIAVSVIGILLCMICLVGTTWAWYSLSVESGSSDMTGANFDFTVVVTKTVETNGETGGTGTTEPTVTTVEPDNGYYTVGNGENAIYRVTLTEDGNNTTKNGFCLITVNGSDTNAGTPFYVTIPEAGHITLTITGQHSLKFTPVLGIKTGSSLPDWMSLGNEPVAVGFNQKKEDQIAADPDDKSNEQLVEGTGESSGDKENTEGGGENQAGKETDETPTENSEPPDETTTEPISESTTKQPEETSTETTTQN